MLGEVETALQRYQVVVRDPSVTLDLRRRAFLRSGRCAEKLGKLSVAQQNYRQVIDNAKPGQVGVRKEEADSLSRTAAARLRILAHERGLKGLEDATLDRLEARLRRALETRLSAHDAVSERLRRQKSSETSSVRIEVRVAALGVSLIWNPPPGETVLDWDPDANGTLPVDYLNSLGLTENDTTLLRAELAHRFYVRAVRALMGLDLRTALDFLRLHVELAVVRRAEADHLVESIQRLLSDAQGLLKEADDILREAAGRRRAEVLRGIRDVTGGPVKAGVDDAIGELVAVELREDWAPAELLAAGRLREHAVVSARALDALLGAASDQTFQELQTDCHRTARQLAADTEKLFLLSRDPEVERRPRLADPAIMLDRLRRHVEDVLASSSRVSPASAEARDALGDLPRLLDWFPNIDPTGAYGSAVQRQLQRKMPR
jgi:hypothetical protein